jgi:hypothetical protein
MTETKINKRFIDKYKPVWTKEDTIFTFFCEKFGAVCLVSGAFDENDALETVANKFIGSTLGSLKQQMGNFRWLITNGLDGLCDHSNIQKDVFDEFKKLSKEELKNVCFEIIDNIDTDEVFNNFTKRFTEKEYIRVSLKNDKEDVKKIKSINDLILKQEIEHVAFKLGKNPKKLISVEEYRKKHPEDVRFTK